jgi:hypothetical protein
MQPIKTFTNGLRDGSGQGLAGELRQFFHQPIGLVVFDVEAHVYTFLPLMEGNLPFLAIPPQTLTFLLVPLSQPYAGPAAVLIDELDAGCF